MTDRRKLFLIGAALVFSFSMLAITAAWTVKPVITETVIYKVKP